MMGGPRASTDVQPEEITTKEREFVSRPARLVRGTSNSTSFSSRLSTAIRRSLRLGPKRSTTASPLASPTVAELDDEGKAVKHFTNYADIRVETYSKPYGTIAELKRLIQLAKKSSIKKFVRHNNWPAGHEVRADLWKELCRDRNFDANKQLYAHEVDALLQSGVKTLRASFLSSDGIVLHDYGLRELGSVTLQRLLIVIESVRPEITHVPVLYPLCALFLHFMSEEEAFSCTMHLLGEGNAFVQQSFIAATASSHTLLALIKKHKSSVYNQIKRRVGSADDAVLVRSLKGWPSWLFHHLPLDYSIRVMDCFVVEGHKMLLRIALAIVYIWSKTKKRDASIPAGKSCEERADALGEQFARMAANCPVSIQTLLDTAVGIRNLKGSTISRLQKQFEIEARDEEKAWMNAPRSQAPPQMLYTSPFVSHIVTSDAATKIMSTLPTRFQLDTPQIIFCLSDDGASFTQLWTKIDEAEQSLIAIETSTGEAFGAYCSASWAERRDIHERTHSRYFGTGESFLWRLDDTGHVIIYPWVGNLKGAATNCPQMFMTATEKCMVIGSGGGDAIAIRDELYRGMSSACSTFDSPPLATGREFVIAKLEVFEVGASHEPSD